MLPIFLKTIPFFAIIGIGYFAARQKFFPPEAAAVITKFVFYFALSAMLFRLAATLPLEDLWQPQFLMAYAVASGILYALMLAFALGRGQNLPMAGFEAHSAVIGNVGFIGLPMFVSMFGPAAAAPVMMGLTVDMVLFGALIVVLVELGRGEGTGFAAFKTVLYGLATNPMLLSVIAGLAVSVSGIGLWAPIDELVLILGGAATPGALFAIGCSLAGQSADARVGVAVWLSAIKLFVHPAIVAVFVLLVFDVDPFVAAVAIAAAAMPTAGNVYILAQHYGIAAQRVSATILISTVVSVVTVTVILGLVGLKV